MGPCKNRKNRNPLQQENLFVIQVHNMVQSCYAQKKKLVQTHRFNRSELGFTLCTARGISRNFFIKLVWYGMLCYIQSEKLIQILRFNESTLWAWHLIVQFFLIKVWILRWICIPSRKKIIIFKRFICLRPIWRWLKNSIAKYFAKK